LKAKQHTQNAMLERKKQQKKTMMHNRMQGYNRNRNKVNKQKTNNYEKQMS